MVRKFSMGHLQWPIHLGYQAVCVVDLIFYLWNIDVSSIISATFSSIGPILRAVNRFGDFKKHALTAPPGGNRKIRLHAIVRTDVLLSSYKASAQSAESPDPWNDLNFSRGHSRSTPGKMEKWSTPLQCHWENSKNQACNDCADWCLVSSYQISAQSDTYCSLWIDLKFSRGAPHRAPGRNRKIRLRTIVRINV